MPLGITHDDHACFNAGLTVNILYRHQTRLMCSERAQREHIECEMCVEVANSKNKPFPTSSDLPNEFENAEAWPGRRQRTACNPTASGRTQRYNAGKANLCAALREWAKSER
jgi:hypothetical protein